MENRFELLRAQEKAVARIQAMIIRLVESQQVSRAVLAERLGVSQARISQILSGEPENITVKKAAAILFALGETLTLTCNGIEELDRAARERNVVRQSLSRTEASWRVANGNSTCPILERGLVA